MNAEQYLEKNATKRTALEVLQGLGYEYLSPEDCRKQRGSGYHVLLKDVLTDMFGQKVDLVRNAKGKGKITIPFSNDEQFEKIMEIFDSVQKR